MNLFFCFFCVIAQARKLQPCIIFIDEIGEWLTCAAINNQFVVVLVHFACIY